MVAFRAGGHGLQGREGRIAAIPKGGHCSGLMKPDTHLGENARHRVVSDDQTTSYLYS
jgi:hypothetical protein